MFQIEVTYYINDSKKTIHKETKTCKCRRLPELKQFVRVIERAWKRENRDYWLQTDEIFWVNGKVYLYDGGWKVEVPNYVSIIEGLKEKAKIPGHREDQD